MRVGGAGILIGKNVLQRLVSHEILGPRVPEDQDREINQMSQLSILAEAFLRNDMCPYIPAGKRDDSSEVNSLPSICPIGFHNNHMI